MHNKPLYTVDSEFSVRESEYNRLKRALGPKFLRFGTSKPDPPLCEKDDLIKTIDAIVKAEDQGHILEVDLIKEIGEK